MVPLIIQRHRGRSGACQGPTQGIHATLFDGTTAVAEDIGRQIITTGRRMGPEEIERVVGAITEKDVMSFAQRKLWDQDIALSAVGSIEGLLDLQRIRGDMSRNA